MLVLLLLAVVVSVTGTQFSGKAKIFIHHLLIHSSFKNFCLRLIEQLLKMCDVFARFPLSLCSILPYRCLGRVPDPLQQTGSSRLQQLLQVRSLSTLSEKSWCSSCRTSKRGLGSESLRFVPQYLKMYEKERQDKTKHH